MKKIICDTSVWYDREVEYFNEINSKFKLVVTFNNIAEITSTPRLRNERDRVKMAMKNIIAFKENYIGFEKKTEIDLSFLENGIYFLKAGGGNSHIKKFAKN